MVEQRPDRGANWAYVSLVTVLPGLSLDPKLALGVQFVVFEAIVLIVAGVYGRWTAVPAARNGHAAGRHPLSPSLSRAASSTRTTTPTAPAQNAAIASA